MHKKRAQTAPTVHAQKKNYFCEIIPSQYTVCAIKNQFIHEIYIKTDKLGGSCGD